MPDVTLISAYAVAIISIKNDVVETVRFEVLTAVTLKSTIF
jgi:hypothetical protein